MNRLISIDCVPLASSVAIPSDIIDAVCVGTSPFALPVIALFVGLFTRVGRGLNGVLVSVHEVQLRAKVALDSHCVTVEVPIGDIKVSILVFARHRGRVEGVDAATLEA